MSDEVGSNKAADESLDPTAKRLANFGKDNPYRFDRLTPEQRKALASKAGKKCQENRKAQKTFAETLSVLLTLPVCKIGNDELKRAARECGAKTLKDVFMYIFAVNSLSKGDPNAMKLLLSLSGEKQEDSITVNNGETTALDDIAKQLTEPEDE